MLLDRILDLVVYYESCVNFGISCLTLTDSDQTSLATSTAPTPPSSSKVSLPVTLPSSSTAVSTVTTDASTDDAVSTNSGLPIIFPSIVAL